MPKVSVIVPVYNVEKYVARCLDSLAAQTLEDMEIVIVNDGSSDGSAKICKKYEKKYGNIRYFEQKNQGLSMARNAGIGIAKGEFIGFVDSDDFVKYDMFETMYQNAKEHRAKIVACGHETYYEDGSTKLNSKKNIRRYYDYYEAMDYYLLQEYFDVIACNKLYARELFDTIKFPVGKLFEDIPTVYRLIEQAKGIYFDSEPKYFYFRRSDSISQSEFKPEITRIVDYIDEFVAKYSKIVSRPRYMFLGQIRWNLVVMNKYLTAGRQNSKLMQRIKKMIGAHLTLVLFTDKIDIVRKMQILLFGLSFEIYKKVYLGKIGEKVGKK